MNFECYNRKYLREHSCDASNYNTLYDSGYVSGIEWNAFIGKRILKDLAILEESGQILVDHAEIDSVYHKIISGDFAGAVTFLKTSESKSAKWLSDVLESADDTGAFDDESVEAFDVAPASAKTLTMFEYGTEAFPESTVLDTKSGVLFQKITPLKDVLIKSWTVFDESPKASDRKIASIVLDEDFDAICGAVAGPTVDADVSELGEYSEGVYRHKYTVVNGELNLLAGETYWFPIISDSSCKKIFSLTCESYTNKTNICPIESCYNVKWCTHNVVEMPVARMTLTDVDGKEYNI